MRRNAVPCTVACNKHNLIAVQRAHFAKRIAVRRFNNLFFKSSKCVGAVNPGTADNSYFAHNNLLIIESVYQFNQIIHFV